MKRLAAIFFAAFAWAPLALAEPVWVLFVGNSYTFGRISPAMEYNAANVDDLTAAFNALQPAGTNSFPVGSGIPPNPCVTPGAGCFEPHPWGGVPGIFKKMTDQAGLDYDVAHSTRNAASLRGQFLQTSNSPPWKLRENVALQKWDVVILQEQSDAALPPGKGKNANLATFNAYADQFERFIHTGDVTGPDGYYTETELFGSLAACTATGLSAASCNLQRVIPVNPNASAATKVYLQQTWARPDMVEAHKCTKADVTTTNGAPIVDSTCGGTNPNGNPATGQNFLYYTSQPTTAANLADMTADLRNSFYGKAATNPGFAGVAPVGDAFQRAVNEGFAKGSGFYNAAGTYDEPAAPPINLWWIDRTHASKYGSYLSALVLFQTITGRNPLSLGAGEQAAADLGIASDVAVQLQQIAQATVGPDLSAPTTSVAADPPANANGWNTADVTVSLTATDEVNGSGVKQIAFATTGAQVGAGSVNAAGAALTINVEGTTTVTYYATDNAGNVEAAKTLVVQLDKTAPTTSAAANSPANANGWNNADVAVTLTATDNANGSGVNQIAFATTGAQVGTGSVNANSASLTINVEGTTTVTYYATDKAGNVETAKTLVVQLDKTPPSLSGMPAAGCNVWPPNHKLVTVATVAAQDGLSGLSSFNTDVASSEPAPPGQSDTMTAGSGLDPRTISVRAERLGNGPGRTYTLSASATDRAGNVTTAVATCVVPHDKGK